ncbi:MAG: hypothetical protein IPM82_24675 [Saprospiraceae bacterium]|nr:hypothetical protein [Saprospiraceae bacterium]
MKKAVQIIASLGIYFLLWKACSYLPAFDKANLLKWSAKPLIFWIPWGIEAIFMCWWLFSDRKLRYRPVNLFAYLSLLWVVVSLGLFMFEYRMAALMMVGIAALPLAIMGLYLAVVFLVTAFKGPIRWN